MRRAVGIEAANVGAGLVPARLSGVAAVRERNPAAGRSVRSLQGICTFYSPSMALPLTETLDAEARQLVYSSPHIRVVVEASGAITPPKSRVKHQWAGMLPPDVAERMTRETDQMRDE